MTCQNDAIRRQLVWYRLVKMECSSCSLVLLCWYLSNTVNISLIWNIQLSLPFLTAAIWFAQFEFWNIRDKEISVAFFQRTLFTLLYVLTWTILNALTYVFSARRIHCSQFHGKRNFRLRICSDCLHNLPELKLKTMHKNIDKDSGQWHGLTSSRLIIEVKQPGYIEGWSSTGRSKVQSVENQVCPKLYIGINASSVYRLSTTMQWI